MHYLMCYHMTWINKLAPAFPTLALRKEREGRGTLLMMTARLKTWVPGCCLWLDRRPDWSTLATHRGEEAMVGSVGSVQLHNECP